MLVYQRVTVTAGSWNPNHDHVEATNDQAVGTLEGNCWRDFQIFGQKLSRIIIAGQ